MYLVSFGVSRSFLCFYFPVGLSFCTFRITIQRNTCSCNHKEIPFLKIIKLIT
uniref:Uncharacterized protein n=1 Tax=Fundulus heteroclitus TaxID=8078 RepID=A0A3Q2UHG7_FUNHE